MCGIAGIASWHREDGSSLAEVQRMIDMLVHRGPDDEGIWSDSAAGICIGQRRLSIIDLSPLGHQPMVSVTGRYIISFNGEIYNFQEIKRELESADQAPSWKGHSDTEVFLAGIEAWGIVEALKKSVGMFALSVWDRKSSTLTLARDRLGEKPLYFGALGGRVIFASELKAIQAVAANSLEIDANALGDFMRFSYVPAPRTIYKGVRKLPAGHIIQIRSPSDSLQKVTPFWTLNDGKNSNLVEELSSADDQTLTDLVDRQISISVGSQMMADVPLGAFLSGGVDSSAVVAHMQNLSSRKVRTYTLGFDDVNYDEAPFAAEIAKYLQTDHTELYVTSRDAEDLIPQLPSIYDEPFADSSQIPTTLISRLTRRHVTVALSGDGGDELFGGYPRYGLTERLWRNMNNVPPFLRSILSAGMRVPSPRTWDMLLAALPKVARENINGRRIHRLGQLFKTKDLSETYIRLMSQWQPEDRLVLGAVHQSFVENWDETLPPLRSMRLWDIRQYLADDLLVKVDRAAMSASLETRAPFLDYRLAELAFALPARALIRGRETKWALRQSLYKYVPRHLIERPKVGFSIPLATWLRGPLRDWANELVLGQALKSQDYLDTQKVIQVWKEHLSGSADRSSYIWNVLMYLGWHAVQRPV